MKKILSIVTAILICMSVTGCRRSLRNANIYICIKSFLGMNLQDMRQDKLCYINSNTTLTA